MSAVAPLDRQWDFQLLGEAEAPFRTCLGGHRICIIHGIFSSDILTFSKEGGIGPNEVTVRRRSRAPESPAADTRGSIHCTALRRAFADLSAYDGVAIGLTDEERSPSCRDQPLSA